MYLQLSDIWFFGKKTSGFEKKTSGFEKRQIYPQTSQSF
jgi:hypothetical protein